MSNIWVTWGDVFNASLQNLWWGFVQFAPKLILAIIQPHRLDEVKKGLYAAQINLITVNEVLGHGRQVGVDEYYRGVRESGNLLRKIQLEIAVNDEFVEPAVKVIINGARTGKIGDGKIFILDLARCIRIRTGEEGQHAIG